MHSPLSTAEPRQRLLCLLLLTFIILLASCVALHYSTVRLVIDESPPPSSCQNPAQGALPPRVKLCHTVKLSQAPSPRLHRLGSSSERLHAENFLRWPSVSAIASTRAASMCWCSPTRESTATVAGPVPSPQFPIGQTTSPWSSTLVSPSTLFAPPNGFPHRPLAQRTASAPPCHRHGRTWPVPPLPHPYAMAPLFCRGWASSLGWARPIRLGQTRMPVGPGQKRPLSTITFPFSPFN
jgi:hypothetical protein